MFSRNERSLPTVIRKDKHRDFGGKKCRIHYHAMMGLAEAHFMDNVSFVSIYRIVSLMPNPVTAISRQRV